MMMTRVGAVFGRLDEVKVPTNGYVVGEMWSWMKSNWAERAERDEEER